MLFAARALQQVAALPFRPGRPEFEVLLITSRRRGRWILPKGWPEADMSPAEAALREAEEEAGVTGRIDDTPLGDWLYDKHMPEGYRIRCAVHVYPLLVRKQARDWRERGERDSVWLPLSEAARRADDRSLSKLLTALAEDTTPLRALLAEPEAA
jgi:8-oxo-dGTP pyrophosphatase MutT (NUDIX family)